MAGTKVFGLLNLGYVLILGNYLLGWTLALVHMCHTGRRHDALAARAIEDGAPGVAAHLVSCFQVADGEAAGSMESIARLHRRYGAGWPRVWDARAGPFWLLGASGHAAGTWLRVGSYGRLGQARGRRLSGGGQLRRHTNVAPGSNPLHRAIAVMARRRADRLVLDGMLLVLAACGGVQPAHLANTSATGNNGGSEHNLYFDATGHAHFL